MNKQGNRSSNWLHNQMPWPDQRQWIWGKLIRYLKVGMSSHDRWMIHGGAWMQWERGMGRDSPNAMPVESMGILLGTVCGTRKRWETRRVKAGTKGEAEEDTKEVEREDTKEKEKEKRVKGKGRGFRGTATTVESLGIQLASAMHRRGCHQLKVTSGKQTVWTSLESGTWDRLRLNGKSGKMKYETKTNWEIFREDEEGELHLESEEEFPPIQSNTGSMLVPPVPKPFEPYKGGCSGDCCGSNRINRRKGKTTFRKFLGQLEEEDAHWIQAVIKRVKGKRKKRSWD
jgi:hypothetical protein